MAGTNLNPAFEILLDIEKRCGSATSLAMQEKSGFWTGVGFKLQDVRYVAPLKEVAEILSMPGFTKVPGARSWVKGIANIRGTLLPIMDLHGFFGRKAPPSMRSQRILVINHNNIHSGILVDEVLGLQHFDEAERNQNVDDDEAILPFLTGSFEREDGEWKVFSPFSLCEHSSFMQVAL